MLLLSLNPIFNSHAELNYYPGGRSMSPQSLTQYAPTLQGDAVCPLQQRSCHEPCFNVEHVHSSMASPQHAGNVECVHSSMCVHGNMTAQVRGSTTSLPCVAPQCF